MFWIISAVLTAVIALSILAPIWARRRAGGVSEPAAAFDLRVYRDQLREVDRDLERGVIQSEDAGRLRAEIGRKVLDADRRMAQGGAAMTGRGVVAAAVIVAALMAGAVALYLREGAPGAPDLPLSERFAAAQRAYDSRPSQAQAERATPAPAPVPEDQLDPQFVALLDQLRQAVANNPTDPRGLELLALHEMRVGRIAAARDAQARLVDLRGDQATGDDLIGLASLMIELAGGIVTPESESVVTRALHVDPGNAQGMFLIGMMQIQNGRPDRAFPIWRALIEAGPPDAPWNQRVALVIQDLAWLAGEPNYLPPDSVSLPGPDAAAMAAAQDMAPGDQAAMIEGMVSGLETRLATEGGSPDEWARLINALMVLGDTDRARVIWAEARETFSASPDALAVINAAAANAGLTE
ncbi:c-type cytochrome biogenesis protein CcmI [Paracoccus sp. (in: a-proteobacteria)]|uniref:c-type cytochrome biogenesis protein CcmI n=1 Tax=Paracoccus sp. TaxID=267 RepID=UPI0026E0CD8F|nr:c-type cytochrome biogenesis protein CcmI [Paracoccus sp. (in: a-proteobacteria)]MDO5647175.1 c-type cytochrome biogenesis protein CcmI [Paracoccus sp. (in: a-proteobacteria)]